MFKPIFILLCSTVVQCLKQEDIHMTEEKEKKLPKGITLRADGYYMGQFTCYGEGHTLYEKDINI